MKLFGHAPIIRYLNSGLMRNVLSPSLLFVGPEGVGKRTFSLELAKAFFCRERESNTPFGRDCGCVSCRKVDARNHPDLLLVDSVFQSALLGEKKESQSAVKIECVRHLDKFLRLKPLEGRRRVVVVEDAEKMTVDAANALLKILEEPPNNAQIVLSALNLQSFPSTIPSRCAVLRFGPLLHKDIYQWLIEHRHLDMARADELADQAGGSLHKAIVLCDADAEDVDIHSLELDEFFDWLQDPSWKKEGKTRAGKFVNHLIGVAQRKLLEGNTAEAKSLEHLLAAQDQLLKHVPAKLVLENLFLKLNASVEMQKGSP